MINRMVSDDWLANWTIDSACVSFIGVAAYITVEPLLEQLRSEIPSRHRATFILHNATGCEAM